MPPTGPPLLVNPDPLAPGSGPDAQQRFPIRVLPTTPVFSGQAGVGTQLFYSSTAVQTTVAADNGTTLIVNTIAGFPQRYPYTLLLEWGTANQEVVTVTQASQGDGPYTFTNVQRGQDGTAWVTHSPGAQVNHGVSARDYVSGPTVLNVTAAQYAGGADPTGVTDSAPAIQAAVNTAIAAGGKTVYLPAGNYLIGSTVVAALPSNVTVQIVGDGYLSTILYSKAAGDCIRMYCPQQIIQSAGNYGPLNCQRSGMSMLTIDGLPVAGQPNSCGLHAGDIVALTLDLNIRNFTGTNSIGLHLDNTVTWTEQYDIRASLNNCTDHVVFDVTTGWDSFGYGRADFSIVAGANQDGVVLQNGAQIYHTDLNIRGDFSGSASAVTNTVLRLTGAAPAGSPNAGHSSALFDSHVQVMVENTVSGANNPQTINIATGCFISTCHGILDFSGGGNAFTPCNITVATNPNPFQFLQFSGFIIGDANLNPMNGPSIAGPAPLNQATCPVFTNQAFAPTNNGDVFYLALTTGTGNVLFSIGYNGASQAGPQRKTVYVQQAPTGGPFNVTWPANGSPTTIAPNVAWPGGIAPQVSPAANAVDVFVLETYDGAHWFGRAFQQQGSGVPPYKLSLTPAFTSSAVGPSTVTGMAVVLMPGKWEIEAWIPLTPSGVTGSTQALAWTFSGTATSATSTWEFTGPSGLVGIVGTALTTSSGASPTMTASGLVGRYRGHAVVSAAGTLQLTITAGTSGDWCVIPVGASITVTPAAA